MSSPPAPQDRRPDGDEGRCEASSHGAPVRLAGEIRPPGEDFDAEKAEELCAGIARNLLGDFSPALLLLPGTERRRAQALLAHAHALFDFARQVGFEGEKLAQINRWEFTLEAALSGERIGQPIVLRMARENERRRWPEDALEELAACARRRAIRRQPATVADADVEALMLGRAIAAALLEKSLNAEVDGLASALVRLGSLQRLGEEMAGKRCPLPASAVAAGDDGRFDSGQLLAAARRECPRIRSRLLRAPRGLASLPHGYRRAAVFSLLAGLRLLSEIEDPDVDLLKAPPGLGLRSRIGFLLRARWVG
ncbi:MAG TPA: squalene/phytoene synthase family protein, partial [Thermoanaerobaculia bacterium]